MSPNEADEGKQLAMTPRFNYAGPMLASPKQPVIADAVFTPSPFGGGEGAARDLAEAPADEPEDAADASAIEVKWGRALDAGYQVIPDVLIRHQGRLKITPLEVVVLLNLNMAWWKKERLPFPRVLTIAKRMNVTVRTVQRALDRLENELKLLHRVKPVKRGSRQHYDLTPLSNRLREVALFDPAYRPGSRRTKAKESATAQQAAPEFKNSDSAPSEAGGKRQLQF